MNPYQKAVAYILPFIIVAMIVTNNHIKNELSKPPPMLPTQRWKIIAGYSTAYSNRVGIGLYPYPYTNKQPLICYFDPDNVFIAEIDDSGKTFTYRYQIITNNVMRLTISNSSSKDIIVELPSAK